MGTFHKEWDHRWGKHSLWPWETKQPTDNINAGHNYSITQMPTDTKLHNVPCVQFSFSNDNTVLSESVEWAVNVIADSVDSAFLMIIIWGNPRIQAATVIWVESDATSWVKTHGRYQGHVHLGNHYWRRITRSGGQQRLQLFTNRRNSTLPRLSIIFLHGAVAQ